MRKPSVSAPAIAARTLRQWLRDGIEIALLDVREAGEFGEGHPFFAVPLSHSRLELDVVRLVPRQGTRIVLLDGRDIRSFPLKTLRELIGFVPQVNFLFSDPSTHAS